MLAYSQAFRFLESFQASHSQNSFSEKSAWWDNMPWIERRYSKGEIDRAGRALLSLPKDDPARDEAIAIVDNWRSCHAYPLQVIKMTLLNRAKKIDQNALIAQRMKRRPSIELKLRDQYCPVKVQSILCNCLSTRR